jgi:hypothetical protein
MSILDTKQQARMIADRLAFTLISTNRCHASLKMRLFDPAVTPFCIIVLGLLSTLASRKSRDGCEAVIKAFLFGLG